MRNPGENVSRVLLFLVIFLGLGLTIWQVSIHGARAYERMLVHRVTNGLEVLGYNWARIDADGLKMELRGHAPDTFARELALESARANAPFASITSYATATLAPPERRDPVRVELLRDQRGITMTGQTANRAMRDRLNTRLRKLDAKVTIHDLTGIQAETPPRGWGPEMDVATLAATSLANAYVVMEPGKVRIDGQVPDAEARARLIAALRRAAGDRVELSLGVRTPDLAIAPFAFTAEKRPGEPITVESCAVRDEGEDALVRAAMDATGREAQFSVCQSGLGGPDGDWPAAIVASIAALHALPAGRIDIEYKDVRLTGSPPTLPEDFDPVVEKLAVAMPEGYALTAKLQEDDAAIRTAIAKDLYWMKLSRTPQGVLISGQVSDQRSARAIRAYAVALFGADAVKENLRAADLPAPRQWQIAALAMIDQLAAGGLEVRMSGYRITVEGVLADPEPVRQLHDEIVDGLTDYNITTVYQVDLPARLAAIPMPAARCVAFLSSVHARQLIDFSTGSARITVESAPVIDALARVFRRCADDRIEVGGHTDSQGPEDLNMRISQARAEAVVSALVERGVPRGWLVAQGYGETEPIADNGTEAGRAQNRRIAFQPAPAPVAPADDEDVSNEPEPAGDAASDRAEE